MPSIAFCRPLPVYKCYLTWSRTRTLPAALSRCWVTVALNADCFVFRKSLGRIAPSALNIKRKLFFGHSSWNLGKLQHWLLRQWYVLGNAAATCRLAELPRQNRCRFAHCILASTWRFYIGLQRTSIDCVNVFFVVYQSVVPLYKLCY